MIKDIIATTANGTINLSGKELSDYQEKVQSQYGVLSVNGGKGVNPGETIISFHGRKTDLLNFIVQSYGCEEGEEASFIDYEAEDEIFFWNFAVLDSYLRETGWEYTFQEGDDYITRYYDKQAKDNTGVRFYFPRMNDMEPLNFSVINYAKMEDGPIEGNAFKEATIAKGVEYALSFLEQPVILSPQEAWMQRGGDMINHRGSVDF